MALNERMRAKLNTATARRYLRVDDQDEDVLIEPMLDAAIEDVESVIGHDFTHLADDGSLVEEDLPSKLTVAVLRLLGSYYEWRDGETDVERVGDESRERRTPAEEREALARYLWQYRKIPSF